MYVCMSMLYICSIHVYISGCHVVPEINFIPQNPSRVDDYLTGEIIRAVSLEVFLWHILELLFPRKKYIYLILQLNSIVILNFLQSYDPGAAIVIEGVFCISKPFPINWFTDRYKAKIYVIQVQWSLALTDKSIPKWFGMPY